MAPKVHPSKLLTYIASIFAITLWGMSYIWTDKLIAQNIPIFYFVFVRILLAGAILFLFNTAYGRIKRIQKKDWPKFLLLAFFLDNELCSFFFHVSLCELGNELNEENNADNAEDISNTVTN